MDGTVSAPRAWRAAGRFFDLTLDFGQAIAARHAIVSHPAIRLV
jgi:hypothetical protein